VLLQGSFQNKGRKKTQGKTGYDGFTWKMSVKSEVVLSMFCRVNFFAFALTEDQSTAKVSNIHEYVKTWIIMLHIY